MTQTPHNILEAVDADFEVKKPTISGGKKATYTTVKSNVKDKVKKALEENRARNYVKERIPSPEQGDLDSFL